jgi:triosephosphate isomerase
MPKFIIANWKMNPDSPEAAQKLAKETDVAGLVICPPFPFLPVVKTVIKNVRLGAQDVFWKDVGAYTGETSWHQLRHLGVKYVIIGHSERRQNLGETNAIVAKKLFAALEAEFTPILCVGETKAQKDNGEKYKVLAEELNVGLSLLPENICPPQPIVIAYEPIWAIGTGVPDKPEDTMETIRFMKTELLKFNYKCQFRFIYGGSVTSKNAADFLKHKEIEGVLVGGASLKPDEIKKIVNIANKY